jgi:endonuclease YncB( thermonuclease family)
MPRFLRISPITLIALITLISSIVLNIFLLRTLYSGKIVSAVYDGDSFVLVDGTRVRLLGVDAPEMGRCMSGEAKTALHKMIVGKHVRVKNTLTDGYGRLIAHVIIEDRASWTKYILWKICRIVKSDCGAFPDPMVNRAMASTGYVKNLSTNSEYKKAIDTAANDAKRRGLGIYSTQCRSAVPPSECSIKGNIQQEGKLYFPPECKAYGNVIVDLSYGDEWFCTIDDAISSGFVLSPTCK